jgi:hypothetical protein
MATWIVHLRIAEALLETLPGLDATAFAVGNIAPDSGMPDEKWEKFTPPAEVTHFKTADGAGYDLADLIFHRQHLADLPWPGSDPARYSFLLGYFCHLVTDNLWYLWIGEPTQRRFKANFEADKDFIWEVKKDWYGLDFEYVRQHAECLYWRVFMDCDYPVNYLDFLLPEGVRQRIEHIKTYYQRDDEHSREVINRERVYLTQTEADQFVSGAAALLRHWYENQPQMKAGQNASSILEIIDPRQFCEMSA